MKRVLQVAMVALALALGAGTAHASVIAEFTWTEDYWTDTTDFRLTNLSAGVLDSVFAEFDLVGQEGVFDTADMVATTVVPGSWATNFVVPAFHTVASVRLTFNFIDVDQVVFAFSRSYERGQLVPEVYINPDPNSTDQTPPPDWSPSYYTHPGELFDVTRDTIPEPASMTLFGLGLAAAAFVRRRRA